MTSQVDSTEGPIECFLRYLYLFSGRVELYVVYIPYTFADGKMSISASGSEIHRCMQYDLLFIRKTNKIWSYAQR